MTTELPYSEACERNQAPILEVLLREFPEQGIVLEIGSGTGQHLAYFAPRRPALVWQPSDLAENLDGISARITQLDEANILPAIQLDVLKSWPSKIFDAVFSSNTSHIMSWEVVCALFAGVGEHLAGGGVFCLYGPFNEDGRYTSVSNAEFDRQLRLRDPSMGLRDISALDSLARSHQMELEKRYRMPANNQLLTFRRIMDQ